PEFVPLPRWNPADPVPVQFQGTDTEACTDSTQLPPATTPGACGGSPTTGTTAPLPAQFQFDSVDGPKCRAFPDIESVRNALEGPYHGSAVHCGVFTGSSTMCDVSVSPSSAIFLPWHAFVDDVAYDYECKCHGECSVCTELFQPFAPAAAASTAAFPATAGNTA